MALVGRMRKELDMLATEPPHGVSAWPIGDAVDQLEAVIRGPEGSPYESGTFKLAISLSERYPFEPPSVRFVTPIFHPNIDNGGRICLDTLKMKPQGSWLPSINISTLLATIRLLMAQPNADDGLMPEITDLFKNHPSKFVDVAKKHTEENATLAPSLSVVEEPISLTVSSAPSVEKQMDEDGEEDDDDEDAGDDDDDEDAVEDDEDAGDDDDDAGDDDDDEDDEDFAGEDDDDDDEVGDEDDDEDAGDDDDDAGDDDDDDEVPGDDDDEDDEDEEERPKKKSKTAADDEDEEDEDEEEDEEDEE